MRIPEKGAATKEWIGVATKALLARGRQIWGDTRQTLPEIVLRLMVGVGDLARLGRDGKPPISQYDEGSGAAWEGAVKQAEWERELKKELGNVLFSTIRWIDDLGLDVLECLDLAIAAQEKFAKSGRPR